MRRAPDEEANAVLASTFAVDDQVTYTGQPNGHERIDAAVVGVTAKRVRIRYERFAGRVETKLVDPRCLIPRK